MSHKKRIVLLGILVFAGMSSLLAQQRDYRKDSLQFKMYTRIYVNKSIELDSVVVKKIFCDYCSEKQLEVLREEAFRRSVYESRNPKYRKPGEHRLALYIRLSKVDFKALNDEEDE
ncbi:hypothetical protein POV27_08965 [Aureisphaera galaxeae]|uniref:hypothetical protein n=1 Tax=Aureisphaera galaxeae TaxID=1538023 RepID=UPI0023508C98|nr:hypothetical protein [Aureisphaera galaxeae]MDC8004179.1 hypothetical protein [Aureisphaera galaxeae]